MVTHNKLGFSLGGDCPGCAAGNDGFCDWMSDYKDCTLHKKDKMNENKRKKVIVRLVHTIGLSVVVGLVVGLGYVLIGDFYNNIEIMDLGGYIVVISGILLVPFVVLSLSKWMRKTEMEIVR